MKAVENFDINTVPLHKLVCSATSDQDYEMNRILVFENYPTWDTYMVVHGGHCSCYGFDDSHWDAMLYTEEELEILAQSWSDKSRWGAEPIIAPVILRYLRS